MTYPRVRRGLYHAKRRSQQKGVDHHAILDVGNVRGQRGAGMMTAVFHMTYPNLKYEWLSDVEEGWEIVQEIKGIQEALRRLAEASQNPRYNLLYNNCEHFARYVASSRRQSIQLANVVGIALIIGLGVLVVRSSQAG